MARYVTATLVIVSLCVSVCVGQRSQMQAPRPNTLTIQVHTESGTDIQSLVKVNLIRGEMPIEDTYMDARGEYTFNDLTDGSYAVRVTAPGFQPEVREADLSGGRQMILNFHLRATPAAENAVAEKDYAVSAKWLAAPEKVRHNIEEARELRKKGDFEAALKHVNEALKEDADFSFALHEAGLCNWRLGRMNDAKRMFQSAMEADPTFLPSSLNLAEVLAQQKDYNGAGRVLLDANKAHPTRAEPLYVMARIQFQTGHMDVAEKAVRMALDRDPSGVPEAYLLLANVYIRRGDKVQAAEQLRTYLEKAPQGDQAGQARALLSDLTKAEARPK